MQRRIEADDRAALWIERIVWNAAAAATFGSAVGGALATKLLPAVAPAA